MIRIFAKSANAQNASNMIQGLQTFFVHHLNEISSRLGENRAFDQVEWFRDEGVHGGGMRFEATDDTLFNRASVNYSHVHYDDDPSRKLSSATAISTIIHPRNPHAPSMHMHISWTELRDGEGYWRIMADLNPCISDLGDKEAFDMALHAAAAMQYEEGSAQGDRYFYIPALGTHRGVSHFYLENYHSGDKVADLRFAQFFGEAVIRAYSAILSKAIQTRTLIDTAAKEAQLHYHTLYMLQVLTLDRGTTSGLLIHDQNDVGILASLPSPVDKELLRSWIGKLAGVQNNLLQSIVDTLPEGEIVGVDEKVKFVLANVVRKHYGKYPEAIALQASGDHIPQTVNNHR